MLTITQLAERLQTSRDTVYRKCRRGALPAVRLPGGAYIIAESDEEFRRLDATLNAPPPPARIAV